jgi:hypothetical protein
VQKRKALKLCRLSAPEQFPSPGKNVLEQDRSFAAEENGLEELRAMARNA